MSKILREQGGTCMIDFDKELEKFKPLLDINQIEQNISSEEIKDLIDLIKGAGKFEE